MSVVSRIPHLQTLVGLPGMLPNNPPASRTLVRSQPLFLALVFLLSWLAFCSARPMEGGSSSPIYSELACSLSEAYDRSTGTHYLQEQGKLANQVHYGPYPIFNTMHVDRDQIQAAARRAGAVYVYSPKTPTAFLVKDGEGELLVPDAETRKITERLYEAYRFEQQNGPQARSLVFGQPFAPLPVWVRVPRSWNDFWLSGKIYGQQLPLTQDSRAWPHLRQNILQLKGRLVLTDETNQRMYGFRLDHMGHVSMEIKPLNPEILKGNFEGKHAGSSSRNTDADDSEEALQETQEDVHSLEKRGLPLPSSSVPVEKTMEYVLHGETGLKPPNWLEATPGGVEGLDQRYAHLLHFDDYPVFDVHTTAVRDLQQALKDYELIYVVGTKEGAQDRSVVQLFRDPGRNPMDPAPNTERVLRRIAKSHEFEQHWGPQIRALVDGRKIEALPVPFEVPPYRSVLVGPGLSPPNLHALRSALAASGTIMVDNRATGAKMLLRRSSQGHAYPASVRYTNHLSKRMQGARPATSTLDYYLNLFTGDSSLSPTPLDKMDKFYEDVLHHQGIPIFFTRDHPRAMAQQALKDHRAFWIVGEQQLRPLEHIPVLQVLEGGRRDKESEEALWRYVLEAEEFGKTHGDVAKKLAFGAPFPPPRHFFHAKEPPNWETVQRQALAFDSRTTSISMARYWLKTHNMLKLYNPNSRSSVGFRVSKEGDVQHMVFPESTNESTSSTHRLSKRMGPSGSSSAEDRTKLGYYMTHRSGWDSLPPQPKEQYYADVMHYNGVPVFFPMHDTSVPQRSLQALRDYGSFFVVTKHPSIPNEEATVHINVQGQVSAGMDQELLKYVRATRRFAGTHGDLAASLITGPPFPERKRKGGIWGILSRPPKTPIWEQVNNKALRVPSGTELLAARRLLDQHNMLAITHGDRLTLLALTPNGQVITEPLERAMHRLAKRMESSYRPPAPDTLAYYMYLFAPQARRANTEREKDRYWAGVPHFDGHPLLQLGTTNDMPNRAHQANADYGGFYLASNNLQNQKERSHGFYSATYGSFFPRKDPVPALQEMNAFGRENGEIAKLLKYGRPFHPRKKFFYNVPSWKELRKKVQPTSADTPLADMWESLNKDRKLVVTDGEKTFGFVLDKAGNLLHHKY